MNAQAFYADAQQLMGKGVRAMFDKRTKPRMAQLKAAAELAKTENDRATAGERPSAHDAGASVARRTESRTPLPLIAAAETQ